LRFVNDWYAVDVLIDTAAAAQGMFKSNVGRKTKMFNSGGYFLQDTSGRATGEFYRAGEDDGLVATKLTR